MTITERNRRDLYDGLEQSIGADQAEVLMQLLPAQPATELVTISYFQTEMAAHRAEIRTEMAELRSELRGEMAELRSELRGEMTELRGEMTELRGEMTELRGELAELRGELTGQGGELRGEMGQLRADVTQQLADMKSGMNRWAAALLASNTIAIVTALLS